MRFRLNSSHYIEDRLLETGTVIDGKLLKLVNGAEAELLKVPLPSTQMIPLDAEAEEAFKKAFPTLPLDPIEAISITPAEEQRNLAKRKEAPIFGSKIDRKARIA